MSKTAELYPHLTLPHVKNPNRFFAVPFVGFLVKFLIVIPQCIMLLFAGLAWVVVGAVINPFVVLFTGKYWDTAYSLSLALLRLSFKVSVYFFGLTNEYPGFNFDNASSFSIDIPKPAKPNRLFAVPLFGLLVRCILLIPYYIYSGTIYSAAQLGATGSSFVVLFQGKYPESTYELARDAIRLTFAANAYTFGLSDAYPSFWISMNHKNIKIALIALVILYNVCNYSFSFLGALLGGSQSNTYKNQTETKNNEFLDEILDKTNYENYQENLMEDQQELEDQYTSPQT